MPQENQLGKIRLVKNKLEVSDSGPIDQTFTIAMIDAILSLPPIDSLNVAGGPTIASILKRLTPKSRQSFDTLLKLDKKLAQQFAALSNYGDIATQTQHGWRLRLEDIIEEITVDCMPVATIIFTTDGEIFVSPESRNYDRLVTVDEFEAQTGRSLQEHIRAVATPRIENLQRAMRLVNAVPTTYTLSVCNDKDMTMDTKTVIVYCADQIALWAKNNGLNIMSKTEGLA